MAEIRLEHVYKSYEENHVCTDLNLDIKDGECFTLLGPSGCGKTVMLRMVAGFEMPDKGKIFIGGAQVADGEAKTLVSPDRRDYGMVFQDYAVWPHMTVFENIAYPLKIMKMPKDEIKKRVMEIIDLVNLTDMDQRFPSQLSGGQQQRVALGRALAPNPGILLLDEPLNNLDANLREEMRFEIKDLQKKIGVTICYVTHDQEIALAISDRIGIMDRHGNIIQVGEPEDVFEHPVDDFVYRFLGVSNFFPVERSGENFNVAGQPFTSPVKPDIDVEKLIAACRPSDLYLTRKQGALKGVIKRASFLGADMDYLISIGDNTIRTHIQTHKALENDLVFSEGDECFVNFYAVNWFDAAKVHTEEEL
jgi:iron(III) transport system ATP-binding protein